MNTKTIKFKKLCNQAIIPTRGTEYAAGYDLYACPHGENVVFIKPGETKVIGTGLSMEIPVETFGAIYPRSGLSTKQGLRCANCVGVIDADYRGEIMVGLHNDSDEERIVSYGDRIAQLIVQPFFALDFVEADELSDTVRGAGGYGSTGT